MSGVTERARELLDTTVVNLALTAVAVSLAIIGLMLASDRLALFLLGSQEIQAKQVLLVSLFDIFLVVAYVGLVKTNRDQLSSMEDQVDLLRADYEPNLRTSRYVYDEDSVSITFRNRGPGNAFNPTLVTRVRCPKEGRTKTVCPLSSPSDHVENRVVEPGENITRQFDVLLPTASGTAPYQEAVSTYSDDWPDNIELRVVYDTPLGETHNHLQRAIEISPGSSESLEHAQSS